jgi:hypothetical protein
MHVDSALLHQMLAIDLEISLRRLKQGTFDVYVRGQHGAIANEARTSEY